MIQRKGASLVRQRLRHYPAVALVGPRQVGKTTLARALGGEYFDLEQEEDRLRLDLQWNSLAAGRQLAILDEAQSWPEVFPRLRGTIDAARNRMGRYLLLGSVSPALMHAVSESLAGRLSLVELTPFLWCETKTAGIDSLWLHGAFPDGGVLAPSRYPQWQRDYMTLLLQRDLPAWGLAAKPGTMQRLAHMLAAVHGQLWNASRIGQSLGLSHPTVNHYLDYLEGAFLVRRLQPWHANLSKRLVRSPKVYWRDSGLLHAMLMVSGQDQLLRQPWVGASWEGFVIEQILNLCESLGTAAEAYFLRTSDQYEIDLLLRLDGETWAIEIRLTTNPSVHDLERLTKTASLVGADRQVLISRTPRALQDEHRLSCSLTHFLKYLEGICAAKRAP